MWLEHHSRKASRGVPSKKSFRFGPIAEDPDASSEENVQDDAFGTHDEDTDFALKRYDDTAIDTQ